MKTHTLHLEKDDLLVSFDVVSLFTKIPIPETLALISKLVDSETLNLIEIFLTSIIFSFQDKIYEKTEGTTMGSLLSPVVANIFMEHLESLSLNSFHLKTKCWYRFVDDMFVVWSHGIAALNSFLDHLNNISPHIQFTMELEKDGSLPFLDVLVSRKSNGTLTDQVYYKKNHTGRYPHAHCWSQDL